MIQSITSKATCLDQVPALFKKLDWYPGTNLDLGGGAYDTGTEYLKQFGVKNLVFDPYNRSFAHNLEVMDELLDFPVDSCTISNVLNVIREREIRIRTLSEAKSVMRKGAYCYISVYDGDRTGVGRVTRKGWQENRPIITYLPEVLEVFRWAEARNGYISAR